MDAVLNWLWQGSIVAVAWCVMLRVLERARANVRYMVSWAALLLIVALPALPFLRSSMASVSANAVLIAESDAIVSLPVTWWTSTHLMLAGWMVWASICTIRLVSAIAALGRARRSSRAFPSHVESLLPQWNRVRFAGRRAALVLSDSVTTASVLGCGRPMIALSPSLIETLDPGELDRVLIHEWAHVQRRDDFGHILQIAIRAVAGWHPAVWWIDRRLRVEREIACDEITVAITDSPKSYAECLIKLASLTGPSGTLHAAPAALTTSTLRARVTKILSPHRGLRPVWSRTIAAATVSSLCVMAVGVGGLKLVEATALALPFESTLVRTVNAEPDTTASLAAESPSKSVEKKRSERQTGASKRSAPRPKAKAPSPSPLPKPEPVVPRTADNPTSSDTMPPAENGVAGPIASETPSAAPDPPVTQQQPDATGDQPKSPWSAAADGGTAIGRKSKQAGVATAGFFTRMARRVAGSF